MRRDAVAIAIFWIRCFTAILSVLGSSTIVFMIFIDRKRKLFRPKHRFMLSMSIIDILQSTAIAFSALPQRRETGKCGAYGNRSTCAVQRFFIILGIAMPLYSTSLNLYYLLTIRYNFNQLQFSSKIEPFLHTISIGFPSSTQSKLYLKQGTMKNCCNILII